jgi:hypothetical protein
MIRLLVKETEDPTTRENMKRIQKEITTSQVILNGQWKFFEIVFDRAVTNLKYPHGFNFTPKDIIQTFSTAGETIIWNYASFDSTNLDITTTGVLTVRAFIGSYLEGTGQI